MEIRKLLAGDVVEHFSCGDLEMDRFVQQWALVNQNEHRIGTTYVAVERSVVLGYLTVAVAEVEPSRVPSPRKGKPRYPLPALRIARLAVDRRVQGQGVGLELLRHAVAIARIVSQSAACAALLVDSLEGAQGFYESLGFERLKDLRGASRIRPKPTPMLLMLDTALRAIGPEAPATPR